ncbi:unnamed protein product [Sphagnum jensenii]|uniref:Uncharacterized protein n=1 Tax=Sphagnum jensenii TaxID=128206 RepID=A0ABP1AWH2_9BRYO
MEAASMQATCRSLPTMPWVPNSKLLWGLQSCTVQPSNDLLQEGKFLAPTIFQNLSLFAATAVAPMTDCPPAMRSSQEEDTCAAGHASLGSLVLPQLSLAQKTTVLDQEDQEEKSISQCCQITSEDVNRVLLYCYMEKDYYDLIHINSFGSSSIFCGSALASVVHEGLVYVKSTDGFSAGEHRPYDVLASYGAFVKPMPFTNELGIQMLIGLSKRNSHRFWLHCTFGV